jgi:hypothetical protein
MKKMISLCVSISLCLLIPFAIDELKSQEFCSGKAVPESSKQIFLESNYEVWEHLYSVELATEVVAIRFLSDSKSFKPKNGLIWYSPMRSYYPDENDLKYFGRFLSRVDVGGVSDGKNLDDEGFGLPTNVRNYRKFHDLCVKTSYKQVALIARSRGATSFISYVRQNYAPNFDVLAGIYPVLDWKSYPSLEKLKKDTGYSDEFLTRYNPGKLVNLDKFAKKINNILVLHGAIDEVAPFKENGEKLSQYSNVLIELFDKEGHNYSEKFFLNEALIQLLTEYFLI